jgi:toxin ParE1/3/4
LRQRQVLFAPEAEEDLQRLYEWIAERAGAIAAIRFIDKVESFCSSFDLASERGQRRDDIRPGLRVAGFERRLTVAFVVDENSVTILRVFARGRNWQDVW